MRFRRHLVLGALFVLAPAVALVVIGILVLVFHRATVDITLGVLILTFCVALLIGMVLLVFSLKRDASLSQLQLDFLSKVSHEFRTPLTSIQMFAETLAEQRHLNEEQRERCIGMLRQESQRLGAMIERLLDFGRMEAGKMVYHRQPEPVAAVIDAALAAFEPIRMREDVTVQARVPDGLPMILADREMISQAVFNLLHNAYKYGGKRIELVCSSENGSVSVSVRDHGPGIPRRERRRIFERFYRIDDRLNRKQEGNGLGLAIVRHVVLAHGGRIRVRNPEDGGAEFSIVLPAV